MPHNEFAPLPILLQRGYTLTFVSHSGLWRQASWYDEVSDCPSHWVNAEGVFVSTDGFVQIATTNFIDIKNDEPHMRLLFRVNSCGALSYHVPNFPSTFNVPGSVNETGIFVEFLPNRQVVNDEIPGDALKSYGAICLEVIVGNPAPICELVFINFSDTVGYTLIEGAIFATSPIDDGPALHSMNTDPFNIKALMDIDLPECTVESMAYTVWNDPGATSTGLTLSITAYDIDDNVIGTSGHNPMVADETASSYTVFFDPPFIAVARLRLYWISPHTAFEGGGVFYIDNVFVN